MNNLLIKAVIVVAVAFLFACLIASCKEIGL